MGEPLNAEQIADLESKIAQLPIIQKHDDDIIEIKDDLEGLKDGQKALNSKVDEMGKGLKDEIKELGSNIIKKIDEKEMGELKTEIRTLKKREEKDEAKQWDLVKIITAAIIGGIVSFLAIHLLGGK